MQVTKMLQDRVQMILCTSCAKTATQRKIRSVNVAHDFKKGIAGFDTEGQRRRQAVGRWKARGFKSMAFVED